MPVIHHASLLRDVMKKQVEYWLTQSDNDLPVAESMLEKGHYTWCLKEMRAWLKKQIEK